MNYIPVSEVEKLRDECLSSVTGFQRLGMDQYAEGMTDAAGKLDALLESATEGVTIEDFTVELRETADLEDALLIECKGWTHFRPFELKTGTLIFIPDKTVVTEGEK